MNKTPQQSFYGTKKITGKCVLIAADRFSVELNSYSEQAIQIFKAIPTRCYDTQSRVWNFHIKDYELLISKMQLIKDKVIVEKMPNFVITCVRKPQTEVNIDYNKLDPVLHGALMPFQLEGLSFGISKNGRCLIADDMGLGKTFQALAIANYYKEDWPLLIVTTSGMKTTWEETIMTYLPSVSIMHVQYMVSGKDFIGDTKVLIVSHDMMSRSVEKLLNKGFGVVIFDESHVLKSFKSKCFQSAMELAKNARRVVLLSGTPALSRPSELYTQLSVIDSKFFGSFHEFSKRYCDGRQTNFGWDASGKSNLQELEIILARKFMIRRKKEDMIKMLPPKTQEIITLDTQLEQFSDADKQCLISLANKYKSQKRAAEKQAILLSFFSETAKIKIPSVCSHILQVLDKKIKFLVFAHHQVMLNAIEDVVKRKNVKYIRIDGSTTADQRKYFMSKFQLDDKYLCAVLSITAANAGITLTAAQLVVFAELHWNPSILSQAEARAHRIGQKNAVVVQYLLAPDTADDSIWLLLQEKQDTLKQLGLTKDSYNDVSVKQQDCDVGTDGLDITVSHVPGVADIRTYFSPQKKRKHSEDEDDVFNDGLDEVLCKHSELKEEDIFNDGMDDLLCDIDF